jgi:hypothetical protein
MSTVTALVAREVSADRRAEAEQAALAAAVRTSSQERRAARRLDKIQRRSRVAHARVGGRNF